ncbi:MAG: SMC family ATPase [Lachnospiraceae bacterium]|nr:SMC family ATPase [Lachnospiraceae bacterium]
MRPVTLLIKGFGSYAEETLIPFEDLGSGLYLITGDTGAGKTTIFDAIMFALYGTVGGDHRKINMMHSDYIPKGEDSVVDLTFTHNGRCHRVRRIIHMKKKRGLEDTYEFTQDADLWEEGKAAVTGQNAVTKRITAILDSLDAVQFQQIIMLAQGEFRKFLDSNSENRSAILGRLFDSSPFIRFQNWLQSADSALSGRRNALSSEIRMVMQHGFRMPEGLTEEEASLYQADHPDLVRALENLISQDAALEEVLTEKKDACEKSRKDLLLSRGKAGEDNEKLDKLGKAGRTYEDFVKKDPEMAERKDRILVVRKAVRDVLPAEKDLADSAEKLRAMDRQMEILKAQEKDKADLFAGAEKAAAGNPKKLEEIRQLSIRRGSIEKQLPDYQKADDLQARILRIRGEVQAKEKKVREMDTAIGRAEENIQRIEKDLSGLDQAEALAAAAQTRLSNAKEASESLLGPEGIFARIRETKEKTADWEREKKKLLEMTDKASSLSAAHQNLYQAFIEGQARILTGSLETEVKEHGEASCPVCGTRVRAGWKAPLYTGLMPPDQKEVDAAGKKKDLAEKNRSDQARLVQKLETESLKGQEYAVREINKVYKNRPSAYTWGELTEPGKLDSMETKITGEISKRDKEFREASRMVERKGKLQKSLADLRKMLEGNRRLRDAESSAAARLQADLAGNEASFKAVRESLTFETEKAALLEDQRLAGDQEKLKKTIDRAEKDLKAAGEALNTIRGRIAGAVKTREEEKDRKDILERKFGEALTGAFATRAAYEEAISFCGRENPEKWLDTETRLVTEHTSGKVHALEVLRELQKETEGLERTDLEALDLKIREAGDALKRAQDALSDRISLRRNHTETLEKVRSRLEEIERIAPACTRIHQLSAMASGAADAGGKLSFERYVMGEAFREILTEANARLQIMTGGRFELIHRLEGARANAAAGLEIDVLDNSSGTTRRAGSISGGEGFQVSLALALGLSDAAQNHAGGTEIDAMFIDEGFGSLDDAVLDNAIKVLDQLSSGSRQIGIISHVSKLEESIPKKIVVKSTERGSRIRIVR